MKISHSKHNIPTRSRTETTGPIPFACNSLLWIGDTEHPAIAHAWRQCQQTCDTIAIRRSIPAALAAPPRRSPSHIVIAQTSRHERDCLAIDGPDLPRLRQQFQDVAMLVLRGPLVAPTVRLPAATSPMASTAVSPIPAANAVGSLGESHRTDVPAWVDSVSMFEAASYLRHWLVDAVGAGQSDLANRSSGGRIGSATPQSHQATLENFRATLGSAAEVMASGRTLLPMVVVAARYQLAESLIDSLSLLLPGAEVDEPLIQWQRDLTPRSSRGFATVVWDESIATPESGCQWPRRRQLAPHAHHVWITGMASPEQRGVALAQGVDQVLDKPGRLECLIASLRVA